MPLPTIFAIAGVATYFKIVTNRLSVKKIRIKAKRFIKEECRRQKISYGAMTDGSRNRSVTKARAEIVQKLLNEYGLTKAESACQLGVSTSAISKHLSRQKGKS